MRFLLTLICGVLIGAAAVWFYARSQEKPALQTTEQQFKDAAKSAGNTIQEQLDKFHLTGADIKKDLAQTGQIIREKTQQAGQAISDATADARVTATIKAKLVRDPDLSAWHISVNTTDSVVTLSGSVSSPEDIGKAVLLAMQTDGVKKVISTLQVKAK